jgi:type IV pilus assembly protein PilB
MSPAPPDERPQSPRIRLGELLVQAGALSEARLAEALAMQKTMSDAGDKRRLGVLLVERGFLDETQLTQVLGRQLSVPWVSLYHVDFSRQLLNLVPREVAEGFGIIPVYVRHVRGQGDTLYVATDDPTNDEGLKRVGAYAGLPVRPMIASATDIRSAIRVYYGGGSPFALTPKMTPVEGSKIVPPPPTVAAKTVPEAPHAKKADSTPPPTRQEGPRRDSTPAKVTVQQIPAPQTPPPSPVSATPAPAPPRPPPSKPQPIDDDDDGPEIEATPIAIPPRKEKPRRAIALTFLDGTTISLPAPRKVRGQTRPSQAPPSDPVPEGEDQLTARDLIAALRAVSHGANASEILGDNPRWEAMFAALLSLLLRKHLIADWEFVEEFRKI